MRIEQRPPVAPDSSAVTRWADLAMRKLFYALWQAQEQSLCVQVTDETTAITAGVAKITFRFPWAVRLTSLRITLSTAQSAGVIFTADVNATGTSLISTKLTIDNTEKTSKTAAAAFAFASTDTTVDDDEEITVDVDQIGTSGAKGLKLWLYGVRV